MWRGTSRRRMTICVSCSHSTMFSQTHKLPSRRLTRINYKRRAFHVSAQGQVPYCRSWGAIVIGRRHPKGVNLERSVCILAEGYLMLEATQDRVVGNCSDDRGPEYSQGQDSRTVGCR